MTKTFRAYNINQQLLMPPDLRQWLPEDHLGLFVSDVVDELDLSGIMQAYEESDGRGQPPYHPLMMVKLLVYGYCIGKVSSRKIEQATYDDVAFRMLSCDQHPDHDSIAEFRKRHLNEVARLFVQVLRLCEGAGLVRLGHVAIDGTKIKANASKSKTMRYWQLSDEQQRLEAEVERLMKEAQRIDDQEDHHYGKGKRGDQLPDQLRQRETRLAKIREAKRALEQEAKRKYEEQKQSFDEKVEQRRRTKEKGEKVKGRLPDPPDEKQATPDETAKRNLTDPDSRLMKDGLTKSFQQAYNGQLAVDSHAQIIVAATMVQAANDQEQLVPVLVEVEQNCRRKPRAVSADAGYFSTAAVTSPSIRGVNVHVPPNQLEPECDPIVGRAKRSARATDKMWHKLKSKKGGRIYRARKTIVEPVFAYIKHTRGFRQLSLRGLQKVNAEWLLISMTHNLLKLFRAKRAMLQPA